MDPDGDRSINETEYNLLMKQFSSIFQERGMKIKIKKKNWALLDFNTDYSFLFSKTELDLFS